MHNLSGTYCVAGFLFTLKGITFPMPNLEPFRTGAEGELLFSLEVLPALPRNYSEPFFTTDDGPGFPEISISKTPDGYRFLFRPQPGEKIAADLRTDGDFNKGKLMLFNSNDAFAVNNALMLLFAFSSANKGALEMHASVVMNNSRGYLFLGRSGTGKSTHSRLWLENIPGTELLNDDNPVLRVLPNGTVRVYGTPWSGKTPCYKNKDVLTGAIVRISQAPFNRIERLSPTMAYASLMASASSFRPFKHLSDGWHNTLEGVVKAIPCFTLECLPDRAAAILCHNAVNG